MRTDDVKELTVNHSPSATGQCPDYRPWLHRFTLLTAGAALALIGLGGLVTSHGVGMAVPDWPNTFGYNMFFFPMSKWVGGVFYEHSHRLAASAVGLLTSILALWLYGWKARPLMRWVGMLLLVAGLGTLLATPGRWSDSLVLVVVGLALAVASRFWPRCEASPLWLRRLGLIAFLAVVLQGVLGGLRVVLFKDQIGIFHAALAQLFFVLLCALGWFTSRSYCEDRGGSSRPDGGVANWRVAALLCGATALIFGQLVLGATMRHQHAGLAITDFPLAYGKLWPATDPASVAFYNQHRLETVALNPITAAQIIMQMIHRLLAGVILCAVGVAAWTARRRLGARHLLSRWALIWLGLMGLQVLLGIATIWSNKAADIATAHVVVGALSLATGSLLSIIAMQEVRVKSKNIRRVGEPFCGVQAETLEHGLGGAGARL